MTLFESFGEFEMLLIRNRVLALLVSMFAGAACAAPPVADESATPDEVITKVWSAAKFLQDKGVSGFASLNSKEVQGSREPNV